ncbi:MAG: sugar ABC transporter permease, partial [Candidatus Bathyarchaeia archaeon]
WEYIALGNFRTLVFDYDTLTSLRKGLVFSIICLAIQIPLGLAIALLLNRDFKGKSIFRTLLALPLAIAPIAIGCIWLLMTHPEFGVLPYFAKLFNFNYNIGTSSPQAFATTILMDTWHWTPFVAFVLAASIAALPREPFESATVEGASGWQQFRYLMFPMLRAPLLLVILIRFMDAFRIFDEVWMLTSGGPGQATYYVSIHLVRVVLATWEMGFGSALSLFLLYVTIIISWAILKIVR